MLAVRTRSTAWALLATIGLVHACSDTPPVAPGPVDASVPSDTDGGAPDAGDPPDAGDTPDAGTIPAQWHAGAPLPPGQTIAGLPLDVTDATLDEGGHLWAVNGSRVFFVENAVGPVHTIGPADGLSSDATLSIAGAGAGEAWVGHQGLGDADDDPEWMRHTGGVTRITMTNGVPAFERFELSSPPGMYPQYPNGRYKLRTCLRAYVTHSGARAGDAWFGCNHGVGLVAREGMVLEHHHPAYCEWHPETQSCTLRTGDVPAIAFTSDGDVWFGGTYGVGLLDYESGGQANFWGLEPVRNTLLFTAPLQSNVFGSEDIVGLGVTRDGHLWAASAHSGLAMRAPDGTVREWRVADGLVANDLVDLTVDDQDGVWLATARDGLVRFDPSTFEVRRAEGLASSFAQRVVFAPGPAGKGAIVAVVQGAVVLWSPAPAMP